MTLRGDQITSIKFSDIRPDKYHSDHPILHRIMEHISTGKDDLRDISLVVNVSPFADEALKAMRDIPIGRTITYGDLAQKLGRPGAARAVGSACAKNPIPIVIPCHRVVPARGGLGNYSAVGGSAVKRKLLRREGALNNIEKR
ncbi:MAG: MGMT family protein [Euryarchaeota archaeon]|nr:MGMT family protein [Euryarchaeota archaeon]